MDASSSQNSSGGRGRWQRGGREDGGWRGYRGGGWRGRGRSWRGRGNYDNYNRGRGAYGRGVNKASTSRHVEAIRVLDMLSPYKGWRLYFPGEAYNDQSSIVVKVKAFEEFFLAKLSQCDKDETERKGCIIVDYKALMTEEAVTQTIPSLRTDLRDMPEHVIKCLGLAQHQVLTKCMEQEALLLQQQSVDAQGQQDTGVLAFGINMPLINARIVNYEPVTALKNLKANYYGKFVSVQGTVVRVSNIKPICTKMAFQCNTCGDIQVVTLPDGRYILPTKCLAPDCHGRSFAPKQSSGLTETVDWQTIKVQEIMTGGQREAGRIPRTVECELTLDLVDSCVPGDVVTISGIVKVSNIEEGRGRNNKDKCMFLLYLHANSVQNLKRGKKSSSRDQREDSATTEVSMDFTLKELYAIQEIQAQTNLFQLIVGSLCPAIYGHELVKAGLILGLFGGTHKFVNDKTQDQKWERAGKSSLRSVAVGMASKPSQKPLTYVFTPIGPYSGLKGLTGTRFVAHFLIKLNRIPVRGDPHILVVGDPGLGKSQMLQAASNIAPRGVYVCGNTTTTSGLTVTLSKDGANGDYSLEAGALVLGDQGCCCIDEFDKMGNQHNALLEAMEQQSISIAKAGIMCSLPARTSILAAANPIGGHYNKAKTVSENLKMGSALLSRFDLVFILLDKPDEEMDYMLSEHVMALHANKKGVSGVQVTKDGAANSDNDLGRSIWESDKPLSERLKVGRGEAFDPVPPQLLRKYIAYARKYAHPRLSPEAGTLLQKFYLELRKQHQGTDSTPITTRQLESLIRLTEARARLELREKCTQQDAEDVVELMKFSMVDTYSDEFGILDFQRSQHGSGMSSRSQAKRFIAFLNKVAEQTYNNIFTVQQMRDIARDGGIQVPDFESFVASLNNQSYLLKKGPRVYQLQTTSF